jgi:uncharacterized protein
VKKLDTLALVLTIVGGLNWGLVGLFRFDLVAAIFGGMEFGETNLGSRIIYTAVGLSAVYLLGRIRALLGGRERVSSAASLCRTRARSGAASASRAALAAPQPWAVRRTTYSYLAREWWLLDPVAG